MTPIETALLMAGLLILQQAIHLGFVQRLSKTVADKIPEPDIHTGHDIYDRAMDALLKSGRDVLVDFLTGQDLLDLISAAATGSPVAVEQVLAKDLDKLITATINHLGPIMGPIAEQVFGAQLRDKVSTLLHGMAPKIAVENHFIAQQAAQATKVIKALPQATPGSGSPSVVVTPAPVGAGA